MRRYKEGKTLVTITVSVPLVRTDLYSWIEIYPPGQGYWLTILRHVLIRFFLNGNPYFRVIILVTGAFGVFIRGVIHFGAIACRKFIIL